MGHFRPLPAGPTSPPGGVGGVLSASISGSGWIAISIRRARRVPVPRALADLPTRPRQLDPATKIGPLVDLRSVRTQSAGRPYSALNGHRQRTTVNGQVFQHYQGFSTLEPSSPASPSQRRSRSGGGGAGSNPAGGTDLRSESALFKRRDSPTRCARNASARIQGSVSPCRLTATSRACLPAG
jgi:hypothetical protein